MVFLLHDLRAQDSAERYLQQRYLRVLFCVSVRQLDVLSARSTAALVSHDRTCEPDYVAGGFAALRFDRARQFPPARNRSRGVRGFCAGLLWLRCAQLEADLIGTNCVVTIRRGRARLPVV